MAGRRRTSTWCCVRTGGSRSSSTSRCSTIRAGPRRSTGDGRHRCTSPVDECVPIEPPNPVPHFLRADGLLDPSSLPFTDGPDTSVRGYVRPLAGERVDAAWLAMICDWFPPPAFVNVMPPAGGISVDMLTHIHRATPPVGDDGWLAGWFEITSSHGALAAEHGRIVTPDGLAVADSIQTRWTAVRG
ncbi:MAG: thioesterase family protein [Ilumatobacteraceae bacterium]